MDYKLKKKTRKRGGNNQNAQYISLTCVERRGVYHSSDEEDSMAPKQKKMEEPKPKKKKTAEEKAKEKEGLALRQEYIFIFSP